MWGWLAQHMCWTQHVMLWWYAMSYVCNERIICDMYSLSSCISQMSERSCTAKAFWFANMPLQATHTQRISQLSKCHGQVSFPVRNGFVELVVAICDIHQRIRCEQITTACLTLEARPGALQGSYFPYASTADQHNAIRVIEEFTCLRNTGKYVIAVATADFPA